MSETEEGPQEIEVTVKVSIASRAMFLKAFGAEVTEGEFKGTTFCTNVAGGSPIVSIEKDGKYLTTAWIGVHDLMAAVLPAVVAAVGVKS